MSGDKDKKKQKSTVEEYVEYLKQAGVDMDMTTAENITGKKLDSSDSKNAEKIKKALIKEYGGKTGLSEDGINAWKNKVYDDNGNEKATNSTSATPILNFQTDQAKLQAEANRIAQKQQEEAAANNDRSRVTPVMLDDSANPDAGNSTIGAFVDKWSGRDVAKPERVSLTAAEQKTIVEQFRKDAYGITGNKPFSITTDGNDPLPDKSNLIVTIPAGAKFGDYANVKGANGKSYADMVNDRATLLENNLKVYGDNLDKRWNTIERMYAETSGYSNAQVKTWINGGETVNAAGNTVTIKSYSALASEAVVGIAQDVQMLKPEAGLNQPNGITEANLNAMLKSDNAQLGQTASVQKGLGSSQNDQFANLLGGQKYTIGKGDGTNLKLSDVQSQSVGTGGRQNGAGIA